MIIFMQNQPITFEHIDAVKEMADKIKRVREIHRKHESLNYCLHCGVDVKDPLGPQQYPCPTVAALDGENIATDVESNITVTTYPMLMLSTKKLRTFQPLDSEQE